MIIYVEVTTEYYVIRVILNSAKIFFKGINTRSAKAVNLTAADFRLSIILNPCIVLTRHV